MAARATLGPGSLDGDWHDDGRALEGCVEVKLARHGWRERRPVLAGGKRTRGLSLEAP